MNKELLFIFLFFGLSLRALGCPDWFRLETPQTGELKPLDFGPMANSIPGQDKIDFESRAVGRVRLENLWRGSPQVERLDANDDIHMVPIDPPLRHIRTDVTTIRFEYGEPPFTLNVADLVVGETAQSPDGRTFLVSQFKPGYASS